MNILEIVGELDRHKHELKILKANPFVHADLQSLDVVVSRIEEGLLEVIREVPNTTLDLSGMVAVTTSAIRDLERGVAEHTLNMEAPDSILRLQLARSALAVLDYSLEMQITAMTEQKESQKPNAVVN